MESASKNHEARDAQNKTDSVGTAVQYLLDRDVAGCVPHTCAPTVIVSRPGIVRQEQCSEWGRASAGGPAWR